MALFVAIETSLLVILCNGRLPLCRRRSSAHLLSLKSDIVAPLIRPLLSKTCLVPTLLARLGLVSNVMLVRIGQAISLVFLFLKVPLPNLRTILNVYGLVKSLIERCKPLSLSGQLGLEEHR